MTKGEELIEELKTLIDNTDQDSIARLEEIVQWFKRHKTKDNAKLMGDFFIKGLEKLELEINKTMELIREEKALNNKL